MSNCLELVRAVQLSDGDSATVASLGTSGVSSGTKNGGASSSGKMPVLCYRCHEVGHMRRDCPKQKQQHGQQSGFSSKSVGAVVTLVTFVTSLGIRRRTLLTGKRGWQVSKVEAQPQQGKVSRIKFCHLCLCPRLASYLGSMWTCGRLPTGKMCRT